MIENSFPVGIVTKRDISRLDFSVIRPNEFKCVYENYLDREYDYTSSLALEAAIKVGTWSEILEGFNIETKETKAARVARYNNYSYKSLMFFAQNKQYGMFKKLHKEEVDDLVIYKKAYDASLAVRAIVDFYDSEKHVAHEDIVCYIGHQQQRELKWFVKNQKMLQVLLNNYYKSKLYIGE